MIVFGVRNKILITEIISGSCPVCKETDCLQMTVYQQYISLFLIPTFPTKKQESSICRNCGAKFQLKFMSPIFNDAFKRLKLNAKTPIWVFTGTGIAVIGLIAGAYFYKIDGDKTSRRVHSPQKDDIFEIRTKNGSYTLYKVIKAEHDSVYFFANKYEISDAANLNQLYDKGDNGFETSTSYGIPISRLIKMDNDGDVFGFKSK